VIQGGETCLLRQNLSQPETTALVASFKRYIRRDRRRRGTLPEPWHSEAAGRNSSAVRPSSRHDTCNPIRVRTMVHLRPVTFALFLAAWSTCEVVASTEYDSKPDFGLANLPLNEWDVCTVDRLGSPLRALHHELLSIHMVDHLLLIGRGSALDSARPRSDRWCTDYRSGSSVRPGRVSVLVPGQRFGSPSDIRFFGWHCPPQSSLSDGMFRHHSNWACGPSVARSRVRMLFRG